MPAALQNPSCIACAQSKRRCSKTRPACQRCSERGESCVYRTRGKRHRQDQSNIEGDMEQEETYRAVVDKLPDLTADWSNVSITDMDFSFADWDVQALPDLVGDLDTQPTTADTTSELALNTEKTLWFLGSDSWVLSQPEALPSCLAMTDLEAIFETFMSMLKCWSESGSNDFIHPMLYKHGMPPALQDAFVIFASYTAASKAMKSTVLQIADERANHLVQQQSYTVEEGLDNIRIHLARLHALFVLIFIRLFDGSVRFRASAERQLGTLQTWLRELREIASSYNGHGGSTIAQVPTAVWLAWTVIESTRRTLLVVQTTANIYRCMTVGHATCPGAVMITARRGLFDAATSAKWFDACNSVCEPLLVPPLRASTWMAQHSSADVDDFAIAYWSHFVEPDKMKCWIDRGRGSLAISV